MTETPAVPASYDVSDVDLTSIDGVLSTTRSVRLRLDLEREVDNRIILDCIDLAEQGPTGGNQSSRRWLVIRDPETKSKIQEFYFDAAGRWMVEARGKVEGRTDRQARVMRSAAHLAERLADVPAIVIPTVWGIHDNSGKPGLFDSVIQNAWSFCLAARARGLGTAYVTALLNKQDELAELVGMPDGITPIVMLPVAWTTGGDFRSIPRRPAGEITYFDGWGRTYEQRDENAGRHMAEGPGAVFETEVDAPPDVLWKFISDIAISGRFSEENVGAEWAEGYSEPALGARFVGSNEHKAIGEWQTDCTVTEFEPNVRFGWAVGDDEETAAARWRFEIDALHGRRCRLRQSVRLGPGPSGLTPAIEAMPDKEAKIIHRRQDEHLANMQRCVEGIKGLAEAEYTRESSGRGPGL